MRPTVIPDWLAELYPDHIRRVIAAPDGSLTNPEISPVEALVGPIEISGVTSSAFRLATVLEPGDLERLAAGACVVITLIGGGMQPFDVNVIMQGDWLER